MVRYLILIISSLLIFLTGCSSSKMDSRLVSAQKDMDRNPDSICTVLESIDIKNLNNYNTAYYYLLHTQALDKANRLSDSSEIEKATQYFKNKGLTKETMMGEFYKGKCKVYGEDYQEAMKPLLKAYELSYKNGDPYWIAKTAEGIADVYTLSGSNSLAWEYEEKAIEFYKKAGREDNHLYALADYGLSLFAGGKRDQGIALCDSVKNIAIKNKDEYLEKYVSRYLFSSYLDMAEYDKASAIFSRLLEKEIYHPSSTDLSNAALLYCKQGDFSKAEYFLQNAKATAQTPNDTIFYYYSAFQNAAAKKDHILSVEYLDSIMRLQHRIINQWLQYPAIKVTEDYFHAQADEESSKANTRLIIIFVTLLISVLIILGLVFFFKYRIKKKENELLEISLDYDRLKNRDKTLSNHIVEILGSRFEFLNLFSPAIIDSDGRYGNRKLAFQRAEKNIKSWGTPEKIKEIEETIDKYADNACKKFREQFPMMKKEQYVTVFYYWAGFSAQTISFLFSINVKTVYSTRTRTIDKIKNSDLPDKHLFLRLFRQTE